MLVKGAGMEVEAESAESILMSGATAVVVLVDVKEIIAGVGMGLKMQHRFNGSSSCETSATVRLTGE